MTGKVFWTSARKNELRQLWASELTCSQIARRMSASSSEAVRKKASEMKLPPKLHFWQPRAAARHPRAEA